MTPRHRPAPGRSPLLAVHQRPAALLPGAAGQAELPNHAAGLPYWAKNRTQRVLDRACVACGGPVLRARRGPDPRYCVPCSIEVRRRHQLRAYLRAAERLARTIDRSDVALAAGTAVATLDARPRPGSGSGE